MLSKFSQGFQTFFSFLGVSLGMCSLVWGMMFYLFGLAILELLGVIYLGCLFIIWFSLVYFGFLKFIIYLFCFF